MKRYDYVLAKKIVETIDKIGELKSASLGMHEDWWWTAERVWEDGKFTTNLDEENLRIGGINGSSWATPVLQVEYKDGTSKTFRCYTLEGEEISPLEKAMRANGCASGEISGPVQAQRDEIDLEDFEIKG